MTIFLVMSFALEYLLCNYQGLFKDKASAKLDLASSCAIVKLIALYTTVHLLVALWIGKVCKQPVVRSQRRRIYASGSA